MEETNHRIEFYKNKIYQETTNRFFPPEGDEKIQELMDFTKNQKNRCFLKEFRFDISCKYFDTIRHYNSRTTDFFDIFHNDDDHADF